MKIETQRKGMQVYKHSNFLLFFLCLCKGYSYTDLRYTYFHGHLTYQVLQKLLLFLIQVLNI